MIEIFNKLFDILPASDKWKFAALLLLMMIGTVLEVAGIGMIPIFISSLSEPDMVLEHEWLGVIASSMGINTSRDLLLYGGVGLIIIFLAKGGYLLWFNYVNSKFVFKRFAIISSHLYKTYLSAPYTFHLNNNTAELIRNVTNETRFISNNVMIPFLRIFLEFITAVGILLLLIFSEPLLTLVTFLIIGGGGWVLLKIIRTKLQKYGEVASTERARMIQGVKEGLGGFKDVTVTNRQKYFYDKFRHFVKNLANAEIFRHISRTASKPAIELVSVAGMIFIAFIMIWQGRNMSTIIPILSLFGAATVRLMPAIRKIINNYTQLKYYKYALDPVHTDLTKIKTKFNGSFETNKITQELPFNKSIDLNNLWYSYPNSNEKVLKNINLSILKNTVVGFVGTTGAGKSTIINLILGLLEPEDGEIMVDEQDMLSNKRQWQNNVGYIPQSIYLSDDTIRNNIAFAIPEEHISDYKINAAINAAQLESFIGDLSNGINTMVGEDGVRLSGGQRQRVGIARALYDNPDVLIMDEGTSSLDNITERKVISAIEDLKGDRTIIMIAHRLSTVKNCDNLFILKKGRIYDSGTYSELQKRNNEFQEMNIGHSQIENSR